MAAVAKVAAEIAVADPAALTRYALREQTHREHAGEIQRAYGYRAFIDPEAPS